MSQYDIPIRMNGGFSSLADAKAHRSVIQKLQGTMDEATSVASDMREVDLADVGPSVPSDLYKDLAPGKGHVIMLSQPEGSPLMGAELTYNTTTNDTVRLDVDMADHQIGQAAQTYKLVEGGNTTYFQLDAQRGVFSVLDPQHDVPAIFGNADVNKLIGGTIQLGKPILIF